MQFVFLYVYLSWEAPEKGLLDQALYKCFIIITTRVFVEPSNVSSDPLPLTVAS